MTDSLDRRTPSGGVPSLPSSRADGGRILRAGVFFGPFPLTARLNPREGAPRGLLTSMPGTGRRPPADRTGGHARRPPPGDLRGEDWIRRLGRFSSPYLL